MRQAHFAPLILLFVTINCSSSVDAVCAKSAECELKQCEYTNKACKALVQGGEDECVAKRQGQLDAIKTKGTDVCDACVDARVALYDCQAAVGSCAAFDDSTDDDGLCFAVDEARRKACVDYRDKCLK